MNASSLSATGNFEATVAILLLPRFTSLQSSRVCFRTTQRRILQALSIPRVSPFSPSIRIQAVKMSTSSVPSKSQASDEDREDPWTARKWNRVRGHLLSHRG